MGLKQAWLLGLRTWEEPKSGSSWRKKRLVRDTRGRALGLLCLRNTKPRQALTGRGPVVWLSGEVRVE